MTTDEQLQRLTGIVESLAASVVAHDDQIEALIQIGEQHDARLTRMEKGIEALTEQVANTGKSISALERQWQAYINTLPRS